MFLSEHMEAGTKGSNFAYNISTKFSRIKIVVFWFKFHLHLMPIFTEIDIYNKNPYQYSSLKDL